ncbi:AMP-binding protein [Bradyrhizobium sp. LHD-71]|uniref:AMP-dependent synthetase/ligase n=1 Tax=Bradyrhizobium sp. LHD-71 TaxID=3072141 RepID=UPI00281019D7|nr:AMP-binding protein [Bradyrhizobium sp. LHD-71]MDQ8732852.1 AMP-binding protein [Bradyrhizobium sp. LHD-71]
MAQLDETPEPATEIAATIPAMVFAHVAAHPSETIIRKKDRGIWKTTTWSDLAKSIRQATMALRAFGFRPGEVACVLASTSPAWVVTDLGVLSAGGISAGLYTTEAAEQIQATLIACGSRIVFVGNEEQLDTVLDIRDRCPALEKIVIYDVFGLRDFSDPMCESFQAFLAQGEVYDASHPDEWAASFAALDGEQDAALIFTAGTSGPAKGVLLSHRAVLTQAANSAALLGQRPGDERLAFLPMPHFMERVLGIYQALVTRTVSNYVESTDSVGENLREVMPSVFFAPPRVWEQFYAAVTVAASEATFLQRILFNWAIGGGLGAWLILRSVRQRLGLDRVRIGCIGGALVSPALIRWYRTLGIDLIEFYGLSEAAGLTIATLADPEQRGKVKQVVCGREVKISSSGELLVRDENIFSGYWRGIGGAERSANAGWFPTGDAARMENGLVRITGRAEDLIADSSGANVSPTELEAELKFSPYVADALVVAGASGGLGALIVIDHENIERWAQMKRIAFAGFTGLVRSDAVRALIESEVARVNSMFAEPIRSFRVIEQRFEPEDPELSPMMKLRRRFVSEKYRELIEEMS